MPTSNITAFNENVQLDTVYYIVSESYPYHLAISEAAGPGYAHRMGWTPVPLSQAQSVISHPHVIDNWLSDSDLPAVQNLLRNNPRTPIFLKIVDPFWNTIEQKYYQFLFSLLKFSNFYLIGPYQRTAITSLLEQLAERPLYCTIPYAYDCRRELPLDNTRSRRMFLSGAIVPSLYPDRWRIYMRRRRSVIVFLFTHRLGHPGYPNCGMQQRHNIISDRYLAAASRYHCMWVDKTAYDMEILKFTECAYAGCVPLGTSASSLPTRAANLIQSLPAGREAGALMRIMSLSNRNLQQIAQDYRAVLANERSQQKLQLQFCQHWRDTVVR